MRRRAAGGDGRGSMIMDSVCGCGASVRARMCVSRPKISEVCTEANFFLESTFIGQNNPKRQTAGPLWGSPKLDQTTDANAMKKCFFSESNFNDRTTQTALDSEPGMLNGI